MPEIKLLSIASDDASRESGLMYVKSIPENSGMLFTWASPRILSFWMKNTYVPLDIIFMDTDGNIIKTASMIPLSTRSISSGRPCTMALEVPMGTVKKYNIELGKKIIIDLKNKMARIND